MAVRNGWNALTLDNAGHSEDIHFAGGRMALAGAKISSGNTYEVQIKLPNGDWTDTYMATVNQTNPMRSNVLPAVNVCIVSIKRRVQKPMFYFIGRMSRARCTMQRYIDGVIVCLTRRFWIAQNPRRCYG